MAATTLSAPRTVPSVSGNQPFGNVGQLQRNRLTLFNRIARECGDIGSFNYGPFRVFLVNDAELIRSLLVDHAADCTKSEATSRALRVVLSGDGLLTSEGDFWRGQRKLMAPAFTARRVASYADTMVAYAEAAQAGWRGGQGVQVGQEMSALTMSIVGKALFDADVFGETGELGAAITVLIEYIAKRGAEIFQLPLAFPTDLNRRTAVARETVASHVQAMIDERRQQPEQRNDLLSLLLAAKDDEGRGMSDQQVLAESVTLFAAGHETTAVTLTWAFYLLSRHPEAYARLMQEVDEVLGGRTATYADLQRLPYTAQVIKEVMRLYPPADTIARNVVNDFDLGGYQITGWNPVIVSIYALHRRADYFPQPDAFQPERWTAEFERSLPRYAYMPFGGGPRVCIGNHFATMEAQLLLATISQHAHFELLPNQRIELAPQVTLRPKRDIRMRVHRRS